VVAGSVLIDFSLKNDRYPMLLPATAAEDEEPKLDISSLIDVCFLLLIYFIVTSIIAPTEKDLPMTMPVPGDSNMEMDTVLLGIRGDGAILLNPGNKSEEVLDTDADNRKIPQASERLEMMQSMAEAGGNRLVVQIAAYEGVEQQRFIDVLNCLRGHGINSVAITDFTDD